MKRAYVEYNRSEEIKLKFVHFSNDLPAKKLFSSPKSFSQLKLVIQLLKRVQNLIQLVHNKPDKIKINPTIIEETNDQYHECRLHPVEVNNF